MRRSASGGRRTSSGSARRMARPPAVSGIPAASASATRSIRISARPLRPAVEPMVPTGLSPARIGRARLRRKIIQNDAHGAGARGAAMLHPRHHFLADIAALVEIDAVQAVHVGFVRKRVAIHEVEAAARHARGDAMRVVGGAVDQLGADQVGDFLRQLLREPGSASRARALRGSAKARSGFMAGSPSHAASTPRLSDRFSTATLARSL